MKSILSQAAEQEKRFDWLEAAQSYNKVLGSMPDHHFSKQGETYERLGYALYRGAFQTESSDEFRERLHQAVVIYEKAAEHYGKLNDSAKTARMLRCDAMIAYMSYWLEHDVPEKRKLVNQCWRLTKESLKAFEQIHDLLEYGKTFNQLSLSVDLGYYLEWDCQTREKTINEAMEHGEQAVKFLSTSEDPYELARACVRTANYLVLFGYNFLDSDGKEKCLQKAMDYWLKANRFSEEASMIELSSVLFGTGPGGYWGDGTDVALSNHAKALEHCRKTRDKFIVGRTLDLLAYHSNWRAEGTEDPGKRTALLKKALQYAKDSEHQYSTISFTSPRGGVLWTGAPHTMYYLELASRETNLSKKRELLEKALEHAPDMLKRAEDSRYPDIIGYAHLVFGMVLRDLARTESNSEEKKRLFEKAITHGQASLNLTDRVEPFAYWNRGIKLGMLASLKCELSDLGKDSETKKNLLQEALLDSENSLKLCFKGLTSYDRKASTPLVHEIAGWEYTIGRLLNRLYGFTNDKAHLRKAIETFENAAETFKKLSQTSRVAECYWKVAQGYDTLDEHLRAAENFDRASRNYLTAAEKIHPLRGFYQDHASYMQAWNEIEKARHHHVRQEYSLAEEHFQKAATLHKSLEHWSYLEPNYSAWAQVESAEELSREEKSEDAVKAFEQAGSLFTDTEEAIRTQLEKIEDAEEKQMATSMVKATDRRHKYCIARIYLEEARILDKKGDHYSSSEKYCSAAEIIEKIRQASESEQELKEFKLIIGLSRAWEKMTLAEARSSPTLYMDASRLFEQTEDFSSNEKTRMLILGHSRFCRALEAGTRFADARNTDAYTDAIKYLESAVTYYVKAGFSKASEYSEATKLLFDAYLHMDHAAIENDPEKKAKLYAMAEKILQMSAGSFMRAEHPEKSEQVLGLLEKARRERELAMSLTELLHAPSIVSTTSSFTTLTPTGEQAVGSERFEHADIQANLITSQKELNIGENLDLEVELVNAGKNPALLIKIANLIPEGFELKEKPEIYRLEENCLNMKGRRLDPLRTEEIKLVFRPKRQGEYFLKPTIVYLDENGKYNSHQPESINISVKELGIKGWLKGDR